MANFVTREVEIPQWLADAAEKNGIDLSEVLTEALENEVGYDAIPDGETLDAIDEFTKWFGSLL